MRTMKAWDDVIECFLRNFFSTFLDYLIPRSTNLSLQNILPQEYRESIAGTAGKVAEISIGVGEKGVDSGARPASADGVSALA